MRILLVEDEAPLRETLAARLKREGYAVDTASDGEEAMFLGKEVPFDVAIIDLGLPKMTGLELIQKLRSLGQKYPILILTARSSWQDKVEGLKTGADDYLVKPFAGAELLARCQALTVRHRSGETHVLRIGTLRIDRRQGQAARQDRPLDLHQTAYQILLALAEAWPRTLTRSELIQRLWGDAPPDSDPLRTHLYLLRQALDKPFATPMLKTVHGVGFRLQADA